MNIVIYMFKSNLESPLGHPVWIKIWYCLPEYKLCSESHPKHQEIEKEIQNTNWYNDQSSVCKEMVLSHLFHRKMVYIWASTFLKDKKQNIGYFCVTKLRQLFSFFFFSASLRKGFKKNQLTTTELWRTVSG